MSLIILIPGETIPLLLKHRVIQPELLDQALPAAARANLRDLVCINRRFGGHGVLAKLMAQVAERGDRFTLLDVGAASADTAVFLAGKYPNAVITSLDSNSVNAAAACQPKLMADAFALPFGENSFDFVFSSLFLHHFTNLQAIVLLRSFYAVARKAVLVSDLERNILSYWFLPITKPFLRWHPITVHDGRVSVRAAFLPHELQTLGKAAGISTFKVQAHRPAFRLAAIGRK